MSTKNIIWFKHSSFNCR